MPFLSSTFAFCDLALTTPCCILLVSHAVVSEPFVVTVECAIQMWLTACTVSHSGTLHACCIFTTKQLHNQRTVSHHIAPLLPRTLLGYAASHIPSMCCVHKHVQVWCRCSIQLTILGYVLVPIFSYDRWWLVLIYAGFMITIAAAEAVSRPLGSYQVLLFQGCHPKNPYPSSVAWRAFGHIVAHTCWCEVTDVPWQVWDRQLASVDSAFAMLISLNVQV